MGTDSNPLAEKSYTFALKVVMLYKEIIRNEKEFVLSKQLLRAGTSIGANVSEANGAISKADFPLKFLLRIRRA